jgi:hypothetical protein
MEGTSLTNRIYLWTAWLFLASIVFQVFAIGLYLFAGFDLSLHFLGALIVFVMSIVVTVASFSAGASGRAKSHAGALIVLTIVQGILPGFKDSVGVIAALHPVNALLLFWVGLLVLRDAQAHARIPRMPAPAAPPAEATAGPS